MPEAMDQNEISRESLVSILEIMHRLASPDAMPELLREIVEVGKLAIVAETGVLWLAEHAGQQLVMVVPSHEPPSRIDVGVTWGGRCARDQAISNVHECRDDALFQEHPLHLEGMETRSLLNVPILGRDRSLLGVMQWLGASPGQFDQHDEWVGPALAAQAAVAIQHAYMTDELLANAILSREVAVAREIQRSTLPDVMPTCPGYDVHGYFQPAEATGGDLYDLVMINDHLFMLLGDATGHGFGPALSATQLQAMLRVSFRHGATLDEAYMHVNNQLSEDLPDDRFVTAFMGFLDPRTHSVSYHSGGQGPILHFSAADLSCRWFKPTSFPVGALDIHDEPSAAQIELAPGDVLALISDGVYEYPNPADEIFGQQRVAELFALHQGAPVESLCRRLLQAVSEFGEGMPQADDITMVLVRRLPEQASAGDSEITQS